MTLKPAIVKFSIPYVSKKVSINLRIIS